MTRLRESRIAAPLCLLAVSQAAFAQNGLDLEKAEVRNAAYAIMRAAEERFDCELEEHSMRDIGYGPGDRYLFHVIAEGDECREALIYVTNTAARDDKLLFREIELTSEPIDDPVILDDQVLIHEMNPAIDEEKDPEE